MPPNWNLLRVRHPPAERRRGKCAHLFFAPQRDSHRDGKPVPQRAGIMFDTIDLVGGVSNKMGLELIDGLQIFEREEAPVSEHGVEGLDRMALALDIAVSIGVCEIFRGDIQNMVIQDIQDVNTGQIPPGVSGISFLDDRQNRFSIPNRLTL